MKTGRMILVLSSTLLAFGAFAGPSCLEKKRLALKPSVDAFIKSYVRKDANISDRSILRDRQEQLIGKKIFGDQETGHLNGAIIDKKSCQRFLSELDSRYELFNKYFVSIHKKSYQLLTGFLNTYETQTNIARRSDLRSYVSEVKKMMSPRGPYIEPESKFNQFTASAGVAEALNKDYKQELNKLRSESGMDAVEFRGIGFRDNDRSLFLCAVKNTSSNHKKVDLLKDVKSTSSCVEMRLSWVLDVMTLPLEKSGRSAAAGNREFSRNYTPASVRYDEYMSKYGADCGLFLATDELLNGKCDGDLASADLKIEDSSRDTSKETIVSESSVDSSKQVKSK